MTIPSLMFGPLIRSVPLQVWAEVDPTFVWGEFQSPGSVPSRPVHPKILRELLQSGDSTLVRLVQSPYSFCSGWNLTPGTPNPEPEVVTPASGVLTTGGTGEGEYTILAFWDNRSSVLPLSCSVYLLPGIAATVADAAALADTTFVPDYGGGMGTKTAASYLVGLPS